MPDASANILTHATTADPDPVSRYRNPLRACRHLLSARPEPVSDALMYVLDHLQASLLNLPPVHPIELADIPKPHSHPARDPATASPPTSNGPRLIAPVPILHPHMSCPLPVVRPATAEPLSRVPSEARSSSPIASDEGTFATPGSWPSEVDSTPPALPTALVGEAPPVGPLVAPSANVDRAAQTTATVKVPPPTPAASAKPASAAPVAAITKPSPQLVVPQSKPNPTPTSLAPTSATATKSAQPVNGSTTNNVNVTAAVPTMPLTMPPSIPEPFHFLMQLLEVSRLAGTEQQLRSWVGVRMNRGIYTRAGVANFKQYSQAAVKAGAIVMGGEQAHAWIALAPAWHGKIPITPAAKGY